ncbi:hypothetical protein [Aureispira sp. CCB-E]|uniref:hypothetical protein n=1 Tax=Aureispira sp. CCB-E TaxID=3051121 RepID=UPI0028687A07|nr:hypothetical protein [Aureispira sp. CCB-E]WMX12412.1 hypothetical protein QP953_16405 [Aureispira sp. CCB-E]
MNEPTAPIQETMNEESNDFQEEIASDFDGFMEDLDKEYTEEDETEFDQLMNDWEEEEEDEEEGDLEEIEEGEGDPLEDYQGDENTPPPTEKVEQVNERISSEKNRKNLERLGAKFLDKADLLKANLCSKISGEHLGEYVADEEMKEILLECIKEYLATKEVTELSPFGALMAALAMWSLPPLGVALLDRFQLKKEEQKKLKAAEKKKAASKENEPMTETNATEIEAEEVEGEQQTDYTHLKEYQEQRKVFETNAAGKYNRTAKGTYLKVDLADELPSPEVQELLDQGKKDREIRKILGYG